MIWGYPYFRKHPYPTITPISDSPFRTLGSEPDSVPFNPTATALGVSGTLGALGVRGGPAVLGALGAALG